MSTDIFDTLTGEYTRLYNIRESCKTSLENKGVVLPNETKYESVPTLIDSIPTANIQDSKSITLSSASQTITPDSGYDAIGQVVVDASDVISNAFVSSTIITSVYWTRNGMPITSGNFTTYCDKTTHTITFPFSVKNKAFNLFLDYTCWKRHVFKFCFDSSCSVTSYSSEYYSNDIDPSNFSTTLNSAGTSLTLIYGSYYASYSSKSSYSGSGKGLIMPW